MNIKRFILPGIATALALVVGIAAGSSAQGEPKTITKTETVTETVEVEVTPQSCLDAIDHATTLLDINADAFEASGEMFDASIDMNIAKLESATSDLESLTPRLKKVGDKYTAWRSLKPRWDAYAPHWMKPERKERPMREVGNEAFETAAHAYRLHFDVPPINGGRAYLCLPTGERIYTTYGPRKGAA